MVFNISGWCFAISQMKLNIPKSTINNYTYINRTQNTCDQSFEL